MKTLHEIFFRALLLLLLAAPPLFVGLGASDCEYHMEVMTLASSQETWLRLQKDPEAWKMPSWNGAPRVNKPPLAVWLHLLVWQGLDPGHDSVDTILWRARMLAASLGVVSLFAIWGIGSLLHSSRYGWFSAIITATSLLFLRNLRIATYDAYLFSFATLAIFCAILAIRPRAGHALPFSATLPSWAGFGVFAAAAFLTKGPVSLIMTFLPAGAFVALSRHRARHVAGLLFGALVAAFLTAPWYLYALSHVPEAAHIMSGEYRAARKEFQPPWYYLGLIGLVAPWSLWLPAAWVEIVNKRLDLREPAVRYSAVWFAIIFIVMSIPAAKQQRYIVPILASAGLLMAAVLLGVGSKDQARWLNSLARTHGWLLILGSILLGVFAALHEPLVVHGVLKRPELGVIPAWSLASVSGLLLVIAFATLRIARGGNLASMTLATASWMTIAATPLLYDYAHTYHGRYHQREDAERIDALVGNAPLFYALSPDLDDAYEAPDGKFLLYMRRIIPRWDFGSRPPEGYLMAARNEPLKQSLESAGWRVVDEFHDGNMPRYLFRAEAEAHNVR